MPMSLDAFIATGRDSADLRVEPCLNDRSWDYHDHPVPGRIYLDSLLIEARPAAGWPNRAPEAYHLATDGRTEYMSDDLLKLEALLYAFAVREGYV